MLASLKFVERFVTLPRVLSEARTAGGKAFERYDFDLGVLAPLLTRQGFEVESVRIHGEPFDRVVVGRIEKAEPHPKAEKLQVCQVNVGESVLRQIVCGARNARVGLYVAAALPGASLPGGMEIKEAKLRDVESRGMLCSREELGLPVNAETDGDGIWELHVAASCGLPEEHLARLVGVPVFDALALRDTLLELNVTPNRPDVLCHEGVAREIFVGLGFLGLPAQWKTPSFAPRFSASETSVLTDACTRTSVEVGGRTLQATNRLGVSAFFGAVEGVRVVPSPGWLRATLEALGQNAINNVVDASNYVLLAYGQPSHAFDVAKLKGTLTLRAAKEGEVFLALDGKERVLVDTDCVVADDASPQALLGVIGGDLSKVDASTTALVLEFANPHPVAVRRSSRRHGRKTDSSFAFEKGIDVAARFAALCELVGLITETSPVAPTWKGAFGSKISEERDPAGVSFVDDKEMAKTFGPSLGAGCAVDPSVTAVKDCGAHFATAGWLAWSEARSARFACVWNASDLMRVAGAELIDFDKQIWLLGALGFGMQAPFLAGAVGGQTGAGAQAAAQSAGAVRVSFPHWRWHDVSGVADLAEEIVRVVGIDKVPSIPLEGATVAAKDDGHLAALEALAARAAAIGYTEISGYHFMKVDDLERLGLEHVCALGEPLALMNPIIRDQPLMHTTLVPNLLRCAQRNTSFGVKRGLLFHCTRTYQNFDVEGTRVFPSNGEGIGLEARLGELSAAVAASPRGLASLGLADYAPQSAFPYSREPSLALRPAETPRLAGIAFGPREEKQWNNAGPQGWTLLEIASHALECAASLGVTLRLETLGSSHPFAPALHPGRRAAILSDSGAPVGWVGEFHPATLRKFEVTEVTFGFELNLTNLLKEVDLVPRGGGASVGVAAAHEAGTSNVSSGGSGSATTKKRVVAPLRFPAVSRDFAFLLSESVTAGELAAVVKESLTGAAASGVRSLSQVPANLVDIRVFDVFRGKGVPEGHKSVAFNVTVEPCERTLTEKDINWLQARVVESVKERFGGDLRGG
ncbi:MAG: phenylalanine--tRNA ligase subunit beta [Silvanigrellales bacterium]|nr:phenylalanine--tRNA ligase subunit beta [Silvanigrellales bacterium]